MSGLAWIDGSVCHLSMGRPFSSRMRSSGQSFLMVASRAWQLYQYMNAAIPAALSLRMHSRLPASESLSPGWGLHRQVSLGSFRASRVM